MRSLLIASALVLAIAPFAASQRGGMRGNMTRNATPVDPSDSVSMVLSNNIFDPNRRPNIRPDEDDRTPSPPRPQLEQLGLMGVYLEDGQSIAFFGGTSPVFNQTLQAGQAIADFQVASITTDNVTLKNDEQEIVLDVGAGLERRDEEEWQLARGQLSFMRSSSTPRPTPPTNTRNMGRGGQTQQGRNMGRGGQMDYANGFGGITELLQSEGIGGIIDSFTGGGGFGGRGGGGRGGGGFGGGGFGGGGFGGGGPGGGFGGDMGGGFGGFGGDMGGADFGGDETTNGADTGGETTTTVELDDTEREDILERLRNRRNEETE